MLRWNGTAWKPVRIPGAAGGVSLIGVAAVSARDAWAVGAANAGGTYIARWNGVTWRRVPSPSPHRASILSGVAATSTRNAWAVGVTSGGATQALILHWNGRHWARVPVIGVRPGSLLYRVAMASPRVGWAVGQTGNRTLIVRWNGNAWRRVSSPDVTGLLTGVTATSARNAWAVGVSPIFSFSCALGRSAGPGRPPRRQPWQVQVSDLALERQGVGAGADPWPGRRLRPLWGPRHLGR
jgi:hypothetical protein